jgi:hypothetical protein
MTFLPGDILVAASNVPANVDLRNLHGPGRILHFDEMFNLKRTLATETDGLVIGIAVDPINGDVYATDARARRVVRFPAHGATHPVEVPLPHQKFGALTFSRNGDCWLGVHNLLGEDATNIDLLWRYQSVDESVNSWAIDFDGGKLKFHRISSLSLNEPETRLLYTSENGRRVLQFDTLGKCQQDDFLRLDPDDPRGTFAIDQLTDGRVIMATGLGASLFDNDGEECFRYPIEERRGWSRVKLSEDQHTFFVNNFLEGIVERRQVAGGALVARHDIQHKNALCGILEYPQIRSSA